MKQLRRLPLHLEVLEDRWVPATVRFISGSLFVSNPLITGGSASLTLKQTAANTFQVLDGSANVGTYSGLSNLYVTGSNAKDTITVNLNGNAYTGNLFVSSGNGNDTVALANSGAAAGTVAGNVNVLTGLGDDSVGINSGSSTIAVGGAVQVNSQQGNDTFTLGNGNGATTVGGDLMVAGFANVTLGAGQSDSVGGNLTIQSAAVATSNALTLADNFTVGKNLTYTGGNGANTVNLFGFTVEGDAVFNLGAGSNSIVTPIFNNKPYTIGGNLTITAGSGNNTITPFQNDSTTVADFPVVNGNMNISLGDGNNNLNQAIGWVLIGGDLNVTAGNGNNALADLFTAGNETWNIGNGNNTADVFTTLGGKLTHAAAMATTT